MNHIPADVLPLLTPAHLAAVDDLEHGLDLISAMPTAYEVSWALERAGAPSNVCRAVWSC